MSRAQPLLGLRLRGAEDQRGGALELAIEQGGHGDIADLARIGADVGSDHRKLQIAHDRSAVVRMLIVCPPLRPADMSASRSGPAQRQIPSLFRKRCVFHLAGNKRAADRDDRVVEVVA
jgi:hypothetical protein